MCIGICVCVYVCVHAYVYRYVCMYVCTCMHMCIGMCVCVCACMHMCIGMCVCVCACMHNVYMYVCMCVHACMHIMCVCMCVHAYDVDVRVWYMYVCVLGRKGPIHTSGSLSLYLNDGIGKLHSYIVANFPNWIVGTQTIPQDHISKTHPDNQPS